MCFSGLSRHTCGVTKCDHFGTSGASSVDDALLCLRHVSLRSIDCINLIVNWFLVFVNQDLIYIFMHLSYVRLRISGNAPINEP